MHSHHSHSGAFCRHAHPDTSPASMLQAAFRKGFTHYNLTEHIPRDKKEQMYVEEVEAGLTPNDLVKTFRAYVDEAKRQQDVWSKDERLAILVGAELENVDSRSDESLEFSAKILFDRSGRCTVDYLVGSVHHVYGVPIDFDKSTFEQAMKMIGGVHVDDTLVGQDRTAAHLRLMLAYLDAQYAMLVRFKPEVVGHFDLCRLYDHSVPMTLSSPAAQSLAQPLQELLRRVEEAVRRNVDFAIEYGALFEVNSASVRKGWPTPYPGQDILDVILEKNGKLCLSDDAHSHEQVALNYDRTYKYLKENNVESVYVLTRPDVEVAPSYPRGTLVKAVPLTTLLTFIESSR